MPEDIEELRRHYADAEDQFRRAYVLMKYWEEETDRRNKVANELCDQLAEAQKKAESDA